MTSSEDERLLIEVDVLLATAPALSSRKFSIRALPLLQELAARLRVVLKQRDDLQKAFDTEVRVCTARTTVLDAVKADRLRAEEALREIDQWNTRNGLGYEGPQKIARAYFAASPRNRVSSDPFREAWDALDETQRERIRQKAQWEHVTLRGVYADWPVLFAAAVEEPHE